MEALEDGFWVHLRGCVPRDHVKEVRFELVPHVKEGLVIDDTTQRPLMQRKEIAVPASTPRGAEQRLVVESLLAVEQYVKETYDLGKETELTLKPRGCLLTVPKGTEFVPLHRFSTEKVIAIIVPMTDGAIGVFNRQFDDSDKGLAIAKISSSEDPTAIKYEVGDIIVLDARTVVSIPGCLHSPTMFYFVLGMEWPGEEADSSVTPGGTGAIQLVYPELDIASLNLDLSGVVTSNVGKND